MYSVILICSNFLETSNEVEMISVDDLRGMLSDFQNVKQETKPLVDLSVLFEFGKANMRTHKQQGKKHTSSVCLKLECD